MWYIVACMVPSLAKREPRVSRSEGSESLRGRSNDFLSVPLHRRLDIICRKFFYFNRYYSSAAIQLPYSHGKSATMCRYVGGKKSNMTSRAYIPFLCFALHVKTETLHICLYQPCGDYVYKSDK
jgi:hypothetical protein